MITGGDANDTSYANSSDTIDGGAGTADTLVLIGNTTDVASGPFLRNTGNFSAVADTVLANVEVISLNRPGNRGGQLV